MLERCRENLDQAIRPIIITTWPQVHATAVFADNEGLRDRIDIFDIEQFIAINVFEQSAFSASNLRGAVDRIVECYNSIIQRIETDPSLMIAYS